MRRRGTDENFVKIRLIGQKTSKLAGPKSHDSGDRMAH